MFLGTKTWDICSAGWWILRSVWLFLNFREIQGLYLKPQIACMWGNGAKKRRNYHSLIWFWLNREKCMDNSHFGLCSHSLASVISATPCWCRTKKDLGSPIMKTLWERKKTPIQNPLSTCFWPCFDLKTFPKTKRKQDKVSFPELQDTFKVIMGTLKSMSNCHQ